MQGSLCKKYLPENEFTHKYGLDYIIHIKSSTPYPTFMDNTSGVIYRGGGLFAVKNNDERKNQAAYIFAKWLTEKEHNLDFVTNAGYHRL